MSCKTDITYQEFRDKADHKDLIFTINSSTTVEQKIKNLDITQDNIGLKDSVYVFRREGKLTDDVAAKNRVSQRNNRYYFRTGKKDYSTNDQKIQAEGGTFVHKVLEDINRILIQNYLEGNNLNEELEKLYQNLPKDFKISKSEYDKLVITGKEIIKLVSDTQNKIDSTKKAQFRLEAVVYDPTGKFTEAGTIDFLAIYSDGSYSHFDYKTAVPKFSYEGKKKEGNKTISVFVKEPFTGSKLEGMTKPMLRYREILANNYGFTKARHSELIPIAINYAKSSNPETGKYYTNEIIYIESEFTSENSLLERIPVSFEDTGNEKLNKAIKQKLALIEQFKLQQSKLSKDDPKWDIYSSKINTLQKSVRAMSKGRNIQEVFNEIKLIAEIIHKNGENRLNLPMDDPNALSNDELRELSMELQVYKETLLNELLPDLEVIKEQSLEDYTKYNSMLRSTQGGLDILLAKVNDKILNQGLSIVESMNITGTTSEKVNIFKKMFSRFSDFDNVFFKAASELIQLAIFRKNAEVDKFSKELDVIQKKIPNIKEAHDRLINKNSGLLISPFKAEFWQLRDKARGDNNTEFFTKYYTPKSNWEEIYNKRKYKIEEVLKKQYVEVVTSDGEILKSKEDAEKEYLKALDNWENNNRLYINDNINEEAWLNPYIYTYVDLNKEQVKIDGYANEQFNYIENNPNILGYYNFIIDKNREFREILDLTYDEIPDNFLPWIRKSTADIFFDKTLTLAKKKELLYNDLRYTFSIREDDTYFGNIDPETGNPIPIVPKYYISPFRDENGDIDVSSKSFDIGKTLAIFSDMAYNYKNMKDIEGQVLTLKTALALQPQTIEKNGKLILGKFGEILERKIDRGEDTYKIFNDLTNALIYGINIANEDTILNLGGVKLSVNKTLKQLNSYYTSTKLGLNPKLAIASWGGPKMFLSVQASKGQAFNKKQLWETNKMLAKYRASTIFKGYSNDANVVITLTELFQTNTDRNISIDARKFSTSFFNKTLNSDMLFALMRSGESSIDTHIAVAMAMNYGYDDRGNFARLYNWDGSKRVGYESYKSIFEILKDNIPNKITGFEGYTPEQLLKFRRAVQEEAKKVKGTMTYDDKALFQTQILATLLMTFKTWMPGVIGERFSKLKFNDKLDAVDWGRYNSLYAGIQPLAGDTIKSYLSKVLLPTIGRFLTEFTTMGYSSKLPNFQVIDEKRLKRIYNSKVAQGLDERITEDEFYNISAQNFKATITELRFILGLTLLILAMGMAAGDDDEPIYKQNFATRNIYRVINRVYTELAFLWNPNEYLKLFSNSIPIIGLLKDIKLWAENTVDETGDLLVGEDTNRDKTPIGYRTARLIKGVNALSQLVEMFPQDKQRDR